MSSKIRKWGNSLGIRIPKSVLEKTDLRENSQVEIEPKDGTIIISPAQKHFTLETLLGKITTGNLHGEESFAEEGNEVW